jgi:hypothetical protein
MVQRHGTNTGVSDVISYILIFSLVISSVGLAYAYVEPEITDRSSYERDDGVQKMLSIYHSDVLAIHEGSSMTQQTAIDTTESTLGGGDRSTFKVITPSTVYEVGTDQVIYETPTSNFTYEFGSLIQESEAFDTDQMAFSDQLLYKQGDQLYVSIYGVGVRGEGVSGSNRTANSRRVDTNVFTESGISGDVVIEVTTPHTELWQQKLSTYDYLTCTDEGSYVECTTSDISNIQINQTTVQTELS